MNGSVSFSAYLTSSTSKTTYIIPCAASAASTHRDWIAQGRQLAAQKNSRLVGEGNYVLDHIRFTVEVGGVEGSEPLLRGTIVFYGKTLCQGGVTISGSFAHDGLFPQNDMEALEAGRTLSAAKNSVARSCELKSVWKVVRIDP